MEKPLGRKAYGSIPHLPGSRKGPGDHGISERQAAILTIETRDRHDVVIVQEKLDGSNVAVAKMEGKILALGRAGYLAQTSKYEQHQLFAAWVRENETVFEELLGEGEWVSGEWLAQAHGTRYDLPGDPFVAFDLWVEGKRLPYSKFVTRASGLLFLPTCLAVGAAIPVADAIALLGTYGHYGATDPAEGVVYRVERQDKVDFLAKFVRPDKVDGLYLPEITGVEAVWNWRPRG